MTDYDELYRKALITARSPFNRDPDVLADQILTRTELSRDDFAHILTRALLALVEPGHVGQLDDLRDELAEVMYDNAHESCDDEEGCTGGGLAYYREFVDGVLMPVVRGHAVKAEVAA